MFFGADRDRLVKEMFVAAETWRRASVADESREEVEAAAKPFRESLAQLRERQRSDFEKIFAAMSGLPVTIRLLDPPLHEFLPVEYFEKALAAAEEAKAPDEELAEHRRALTLVRELREANPMLGTRGIRLAVLYPPLYEMQVGAIIEAAAECSKAEIGRASCRERV